VRIYHGESENTFSAKFAPNEHTAELICETIANREGLTDLERTLFSLWVVSKDLELQIRPQQDIFEVISVWNEWVVKYTHYPEAANPEHPINRHWFVYKREATVTLKEEKLCMRENSQLLIYGQAKMNLLSSRYVCAVYDAAELAGIMLQILQGDYIAVKYPAGYLHDISRLETLIPEHLIEKMKPSEWETIITERYAGMRGTRTVNINNCFRFLLVKRFCPIFENGNAMDALFFQYLY
jgi:hypothetical protein